MSWTLRAGNRSLDFTSEVSGLGLLETPHVEPIADVEGFANPRRDFRRFGLMRRVGQVVSLAVEARPDHRPLPEVWRELLAVWRADEVRSTPGALATLTSPDGLTVYGLPVDIAPDQKNRLFGLDRASLDFECVDDLWYGPESETTIRLIPPTGGGLTFPAEAPFTFDSGPTERNGSVLVTGDVAVSPVFEIRGPITNPEIDVVGVGRLRFSTELAYDQTLTVDTRHWAQWVKRDGAALPGVLMPSSAWLTDISLVPGAYTVMLRGYDPTGTATLTVRTAPAFTSF